MHNQILALLEKDSRTSHADIAVMLGISEEQVASAIQQLTEEQIICGYTTLINWDKVERSYVSALIEVKVTLQRGQGFDRIAERIYQFEKVKAVYLMSGGFDLTVIIEGDTIKEIAHFVSEKLASLDSVLSTATHFVLKKYKDYGIVIEKKSAADERIVIS